MKITNCKIKKETIVYEVLTSGNGNDSLMSYLKIYRHRMRVNTWNLFHKK